tara:strand:- start:129312 stop:131381 length:2070 start_codon:yes stop_codon:yes gene_type:complete
MLKFIRKYQLIILAVGGSLLMVVFLFQPILGKLSPDPRKAAVGKLADGTSFTGFDFQRASFDLSVLKRVYPRVFAPLDQGGLGLSAGSGDESEQHWLLLTKQARDAGLIGESGEGRGWVPMLAQREAATLIQQQAQQGLFTSQEQVTQALADMTDQIENALTRNVSLATGMMRGITVDEVYRTLAAARGVERLYRVFTSIPAFSDLGAMHAAKERYDAIAVDAVLIKGDLFANSIPEPSDAELQAFFDQYKADAPSDNDYQIGYTQPARVKMGWLTLDKRAIEDGVVVDRVELNKIWRADHNLPEGSRKYPGDFAGERVAIEQAFRADRALDIMVEADKILRSQTLQATRGLAKDGDFFVLPANWSTIHPTLESMAQSIVDGLKERLSVTIPLPTVEIHAERWLTSADIAGFPSIGSAAYRIGSRSLPANLLPQATDSQEATALITIQSGVPIVDPAAEDALGNRYYAIVYEVNPAGPADSIADAGREKVLKDYKTVKAYEMLSANIDSMIAQAQSANDLAPAVTAAMALGDTGITRPGVARNLLVREQGVARGRLASFVDPGLNTPAFRDAVLEATKGLDQLSTPEALAASPVFVAAAIPSTKGIGLAKVIAPRPMTGDQFRAEMDRIVLNEAGEEIRAALNETESSPFSLDTMIARYGYIKLKKRGDEVEAKPTATDSDSDSEDSES